MSEQVPDPEGEGEYEAYRYTSDNADGEVIAVGNLTACRTAVRTALGATAATFNSHWYPPGAVHFAVECYDEVPGDWASRRPDCGGYGIRHRAGS